VLIGCAENTNPIGQATKTANDAVDWAKKQVGDLPDSLGDVGDILSESLPGGSGSAAAGAKQVTLKKNIDPEYAFIQEYLSGKWVQEPYSRGCDRESILKGEDDGKDDGGHYVEFSFDGNAVTQYDHYVSHGHENILETVAIIKSASQSKKNLGNGRTKIGEVLVTPQRSKLLSGISGNSGTPKGFAQPKIFLVSGDFSAEAPAFSGRGIYSNGVAGGPPQLYSCSGTFERRE
jgi:hypothetical protein